VKLITHLHLVPRSRLCRAVSPPPNTPPRRDQLNDDDDDDVMDVCVPREVHLEVKT
jgi:hypothetical protein